MILESLGAFFGGILLGHLVTKYPKKKEEKKYDNPSSYGRNISVVVKDGEVIEEIVGEIKPVEDKDFDRLLSAVTNEVHDIGRLNLIKMSVKTNRGYTCEQVLSLCDQFDHDDNRSEAAILIYPRIKDKEDFIIVLNSFSFSNYKAKVMTALQLI